MTYDILDLKGRELAYDDTLLFDVVVDMRFSPTWKPRCRARYMVTTLKTYIWLLAEGIYNYNYVLSAIVKYNSKHMLFVVSGDEYVADIHKAVGEVEGDV